MRRSCWLDSGLTMLPYSTGMTPPQTPHGLTLTRRHAIASVATWLGAMGISAATPATAQTPDAVDAIWQDSARSRALPIRLRWPAPQTPMPVGGWPVILYSHGLGGTARGAAVWGQAWAQAGFVVVHVQHPGSDQEAVRAAPRTGLGHLWLQKIGSAEQLLARVNDIVFVLDEIARLQALGQQWANIRANAVGLAGHSFGAHTALGAGGQTYLSQAGIKELRIAALIALSPTIPLKGDPAEAFAQITRPTLCITGTLDGDVLGNGATPERRAAVYAALPAGQKAMLLLDGADHSTFSGNLERSGSLHPAAQRDDRATRLQPQHHALVAGVATLWWRQHLQRDDAAARLLLAPPGLNPADQWLTG